MSFADTVTESSTGAGMSGGVVASTVTVCVAVAVSALDASTAVAVATTLIWLLTGIEFGAVRVMSKLVMLPWPVFRVSVARPSLFGFGTNTLKLAAVAEVFTNS